MEEDDDFTIECTQEEVEALTEKLLDNDDNNCSKFFRYSEGGFLKKVFGENLTGVLRKSANFPGDLWENCSAVLRKTTVKPQNHSSYEKLSEVLH